MLRIILAILVLLTSCQNNEYVNTQGALIAWCSTKKSFVWVKDSSTGVMHKIYTGKYIQPSRGLSSPMQIQVKKRRFSGAKAKLISGQVEPGPDLQTYCKCIKGNESLIY